MLLILLAWSLTLSGFALVGVNSSWWLALGVFLTLWGNNLSRPRK